MRRTHSTAAIVTGTIAITLAAILATVALIVGVGIAARPQLGYDIYAYFGDAGGKYTYAKKIYEREKNGDAMTAALPALYRVVTDGLAAENKGKRAEGLAAYVRLLIDKLDEYPEFERELDEKAIEKSRTQPVYHVFVTGYGGYLAGEYVRLTLKDGGEAVIGALDFAFKRFDAFAASLLDDLGSVRADSALDVFVGSYSDGGAFDSIIRPALAEKFQTALELFAEDGAVASAVAAQNETTDALFGALHAAKCITRLFAAYETVGYRSASVAEHWNKELSRLLQAYVAVQPQEAPTPETETP